MEQNNFKMGDTVLTLDPREDEVFYKIIEEKKDTSQATWFTLEGYLFQGKVNIPLLNMNTKYVKVESTTTSILFGVNREIRH